MSQKHRSTSVPSTAEPSQEWGERIETSRSIALGGKKEGHVPGTSEKPESDKDTEVIIEEEFESLEVEPLQGPTEASEEEES